MASSTADTIRRVFRSNWDTLAELEARLIRELRGKPAARPIGGEDSQQTIETASISARAAGPAAAPR